MAQSSIEALLPKRNRRQEKQAKGLPARVGRRNRGLKVDKYKRYRMFVGKPNGPGQPGNKSGKNKI